MHTFSCEQQLYSMSACLSAKWFAFSSACRYKANGHSQNLKGLSIERVASKMFMTHFAAKLRFTIVTLRNKMCLVQMLIG